MALRSVASRFVNRSRGYPTQEYPGYPYPNPNRPNRWIHHFLKFLVVLLTVSVVATGGALVYVRKQVGSITRVEIAELEPTVAAEPMNVLLVGSDSRANLTGDMADQAGKGEVSGRRSDTIMVLRLDPRQTKATIVSIPRDLYVPIAGTRRRDRVNAAFSLNGAQGLVATIEGALGISINHYVEVDFVGFRDIVEAIGGVPMYVPFPTRDRFSGLNIKTPGCVLLKGDEGLAWVRSRTFETLQTGRWRTDPTSDIGRIERQQDFIRRIMRKAVGSGLSNPLVLNRLINIGVSDVTLDAGMSTRDIASIGSRFRSFDASQVEMLTLPTSLGNVGGASVLFLKKEEARPLIDRLNGLDPPPASTALLPGKTPPSTPGGSGSVTSVTTAAQAAAAACGGDTSVLRRQSFF